MDLARARQEVPGLLEDLRESNPQGFEWVSDVFSEVLYQLRWNCVKDEEMVRLLFESIQHHNHS